MDCSVNERMLMHIPTYLRSFNGAVAGLAPPDFIQPMIPPIVLSVIRRLPPTPPTSYVIRVGGRRLPEANGGKRSFCRSLHMFHSNWLRYWTINVFLINENIETITGILLFLVWQLFHTFSDWDERHGRYGVSTYLNAGRRVTWTLDDSNTGKCKNPKHQQISA